MKFFSKENIQYIRNNFQLVYGIILLILIPAALVVNTLVFISNTQKTLDTELQKKAALATSIFGAEVSDEVGQTEHLQAKLEQMAADNTELKSIDILIPDQEDFKIVASLDAASIGTIPKYIYNTLAWQSSEAIAFSTTSPSLSSQDQKLSSKERFWVIVQPVKNTSGEKVAIVSMKISSKIIDDLTRGNLTRSIIILVVSIIIIILLLLNNTRMFQYALLAKKLKEVDEMKDDFISMASHELRAPITGIRGYLQMIIDKSFGDLPPEAEEKLKMVFRESTRLNDLVDDLLNVSRIEQGRMQVAPKALNISLICEDIIESFAKQAKDKSLLIKQDIKLNIPAIWADEQKFKQVIVNIISNAIKYTAKGSVTLSAIKKDSMVEIKISDTGIGMSAKDREHLFEKFYRVRNEKTDGISGTGLGLWITKELVELMKGQMYVDSMENVGTQVTISLPVAKDMK